MAILLALAAAVLYGTADFAGGVGSRQASVLAFLALSAPVGAVIMLAAALAPGGSATAASLGWGLAAGVASGAGVIVFFAGLSAGPVRVVAPLSALGAALLPVGAAVAEGARPGAAVLAGAGLCLAAVTLVSLEGGTSGSPAGGPPPGWRAGSPRAWRSGCISCSSGTWRRVAGCGRWPCPGARPRRLC